MQTLADENLILFVHCFAKGHDTLQVTAIHVLADILTIHPSLISSLTADAALRKSVLKIFAKGMKAEHTPGVQAAATIALCKLMLTSVIRDEDLLRQMVVCYFDPVTKDNAGVRQALSYFLPVYCHSRTDNMERMANVAGGVMRLLVNMSQELEEGDEMVGISTVGSMLVDWTDARKLMVPDVTNIGWDEAGKKEVKAVNGNVHFDLAESLLQQAINHGSSSKSSRRIFCSVDANVCTEEEKKALIAMLGKLHISADSKTERLQKTTKLVVEAIEDKIAQDAPSRNALNRLHSALVKALGHAELKQISGDMLAPAGGVDGVDDEGVSEVQGSLLEDYDS